jgi:tetratricopeptide (TPR) repeat protein
MPGLHYSLGSLCWKEGDWQQAEDEFRKELQIAPENYLATWKLGNVYLNQRRYDHAFVYLRKAIQQKPDLAQAHRDLGRALLQAGDYEQSIRELKKVSEMAPDESTSHYLLAQDYKKLGRTADQQSELEVFEKLRRAEQERGRVDLLGSGSQDERKPGAVEDLPDEP